ncbi:MAG: YicC family protein [Eubacterium sp.]|nr:YicC family protein [Eubacterium sp.]
MISSMTGFGHGEAADEFRRITVEMKSVNHRYLELGIKLPRRMNSFENDIRNRVKNRISRGKVDLFVTVEDHSEGTTSVVFDKNVARAYLGYFREMEEELGVENDIKASDLARLNGVFEVSAGEGDDEAIEALLNRALDEALDAFCKTRAVEGESLKNDLCGKLDDMLSYVDRIEVRYPDVVAAYRQRLYEKVKEVIDSDTVDEGRIASEVVIYSDKICVDEETVRLRTHIDAMKKTLQSGGSCGRKLDFIAQEMNRESNTILSKSSDADIADVAIELKTDVEKVREQVQNIE